MRPIDADELINKLAKEVPYIIDDAVTDAYVAGLKRAKIKIERMPTIEPERKTGKWIWVECVDVEGLGASAWKCSECEEIYRDADNYCPNCGAKMEGEKVRLIDADALKRKKVRSNERCEWVVPVAEIDWMPTIETERKTGKWIHDGKEIECGRCGAIYPDYSGGGITKGATFGKWISVSERLPEEADGTVLVCMPDESPYNKREQFIKAKHNQQVETAHYSQHSDTWYYAMGAVSETRPIAWMPLPEPVRLEE